MRDQLSDALKTAMKSGDKKRVSTIRMITSTIKDKDIAARDTGKPLGDAEIVEVLAKMVKSREDAAKQFEDGGRPELAAGEREEIAIIREFLPAQMDEADAEAAVKAVVAEIGATSVKDMGRVMAALKERYAGRMDFGRISGVVKAALG
ncbi:GatB/YqeY domain-containing protein [Methyloraptor flagellatus]|uniref:GatB/YqeY domain-containing protein n=1 Tax=Methyloraptor flagellatus TaxID=3162530 RepID=A0AAU7XB44_9HYPH